MTLVEQFDKTLAACRELFMNKYKDYGATWLIYRWECMADQLWIKGRRIRTLEESEVAHIAEGRDVEYVGLINYSIIALIKYYHNLNIDDLESTDEIDISNLQPGYELIGQYYDNVANRARELMVRKNHDYGDAWKDMHAFSITDQILTKILRIKNIIKNNRKLTVSEDIDAQLFDVINYSVFALIKIESAVISN